MKSFLMSPVLQSNLLFAPQFLEIPTLPSVKKILRNLWNTLLTTQVKLHANKGIRNKKYKLTGYQIQIRFFISSLIYDIVVYGVSHTSQNCKPAAVVSTAEECKVAAKQLNFTYKWTMDRRDRHAGCYKDFNNGFVYFNKVTNPTETTPDLGTIGRRAICIDDGNVFDD